MEMTFRRHSTQIFKIFVRFGIKTSPTIYFRTTQNLFRAMKNVDERDFGHMRKYGAFRWQIRAMPRKTIKSTSGNCIDCRIGHWPSTFIGIYSFIVEKKLFMSIKPPPAMIIYRVYQRIMCFLEFLKTPSWKLKGNYLLIFQMPFHAPKMQMNT